MSKALIIGSEGQDGRLLSESLDKAGHEFVGISRSRIRTNIPGLTLQPASISSPTEVRKLLETFQPDEIYYLAAFHHSSEEEVPENIEMFRKSFEVNALYVVHFLEAIRSLKLKSRLFYACSSHVFGTPSTEYQDENTPFQPNNIYGISKLTGLLACRLYRESHGVFASTGILYNHESHLRQRKFLSKKIVSTAVEISQGRTNELRLGNLSAIVDWGYAADFVEAMQLILRAEQPDEFVVATGEKHSVSDFVKETFQMLGLEPSRFIKEDSSLVNKPSLPLIGQANKLKTKTGWQPKVGFQEMIRKMIEAEGVKTQ